MLPIDHNICSFSTWAVTDENDFVKDMTYTSVAEVRESEGYQVRTFHELVAFTGLIALRNRKHDLFFRGQAIDHKDSNGRSIIYPSICRPDGGRKCIHTSVIADRYHRLTDFVASMKQKQFRERYDEYYYALIQHYEILPTPLIDITQSLRVAATFALRNSNIGYLYVVGLPYPQGSISHFVDQNMVLVKLQAVCPANAKRPRYQEGFLVGRLPFEPVKTSGDNLATRLLAKIKLINSNDQFWPQHLGQLPDELLFPEKDIYLKWLSSISLIKAA